MASNLRDQHRYYECPTRKKKGVEACDQRPLAAAAIEDHVLEHVRAAVDDEALVAEVRAGAESRLAAERSELLAERNALGRLIAKTRDELGTLNTQP